MISVLGPKNRHESLAQKAVSIKNGLKFGKKYFTRLCVLKYPFIPINALLAAMSFFFIFSRFSFLNLVYRTLRSSSPKPQNIEM